jgi:1,4-alpha-glucan branching enzyme
MNKGYWIPVLHSHLPFVKHPKYDYFLEEHWLFEAITECYIPLLRRMKMMIDEGVDFRLTTSITPPLAQMLDDEHLMNKYKLYLDKHIKLSLKEQKRVKGSEFENIVEFYIHFFKETKEFFEDFLSSNVLNGYRFFNDLGKVEVITCGATHGFLPLLRNNERSIHAQIKIAIESHKRHFHKHPKGIWLAECAYYDGLDEILKEYDLEFFFMDSHAFVYANPPAENGVYQPIYTPNKVAAFARDPHSAKQVWSSKEGYPGDFSYRDFYRDIGYDLDFDYIKDYIDPDGSRVFTGMKYYKITSESDHKEIYDPLLASWKTIDHAQNFHFNREKQFEFLSSHMQRTPMVVSNYDAELFGHWWFEGVEFLYNVFKEIDKHKVFKAITPLEYLEMYPENQLTNPQASSWGDKGYYDVWLNEGNSWIYRHLHFMADNLTKLANENYHTSDDMTIRVLNQMLRELLLAQSSDWAFLITTETAIEYSVNRTKEHIENYLKLSSMISSNIDTEFLEECEEKNSIFDFADFRIYSD